MKRDLERVRVNHAPDLREVLLASLPGAAAQNPGAASLWVAMAAVQDWRAWLPQAAALLSEPERERVARMRRPEDRDTRVLAYALHRLLLSRWLHLDAVQVPITRDGQGRPLIADSALSTSLSHTRGAVAIAISGAGPVGIDIEAIVRPLSLDDIATQVCHPCELSLLQALPHQLRQRRLLDLWVRKEAYLKAVGVGLAWDMSGFTAAPEALLPVPVADAGNAVQARLSTVALHPAFALACAAPAQLRSVDFLLVPVGAGTPPVPTAVSDDLRARPGAMAGLDDVRR